MSKKSSSKINLNFKLGEIWYVRWIDSYSLSENRWMSASEVEELMGNPSMIEEVGFVVGLTDDFVGLVGGQCIEEEFQNKYHRDVMIPLSVIVYSKRISYPHKKG